MSLYYYNSSLDQDENGNVLCSENGLVGVKRKVSSGKDYSINVAINNTIAALLTGDLTEEEKGSGVSTEFPLDLVYLNESKTVLSENGDLILYFYDPSNKTSGGACRTTIFRNQIIKTAEQFDEVESVTIMPEEFFQP